MHCKEWIETCQKVRRKVRSWRSCNEKRVQHCPQHVLARFPLPRQHNTTFPTKRGPDGQQKRPPQQHQKKQTPSLHTMPVGAN